MIIFSLALTGVILGSYLYIEINMMNEQKKLKTDFSKI